MPNLLLDWTEKKKPEVNVSVRHVIMERFLDPNSRVDLYMMIYVPASHKD